MSKAKNGGANGHVSPEQWPASKVELWPLSRIKPYDKNPNTHSEEQIELIAKAMTGPAGVTSPILVDELEEILYGHGRRLAAIRNGFPVYPVIQALNLTEDQKRALRIQDNQLARLSAWDMGLLRDDAAILNQHGFDLTLLGFSEQMTTWLTTGDLVLDPEGEWAGMPHFSNPDAKAFRSIIVHFHDQAGVDAFCKLVNQEISDKAKFLWFPEMIIKPFMKFAGKGQKAPAKAALK